MTHTSRQRTVNRIARLERQGSHVDFTLGQQPRDEEFESDEIAIWQVTREDRHELVAAVLVGLLLTGVVIAVAWMK